MQGVMVCKVHRQVDREALEVVLVREHRLLSPHLSWFPTVGILSVYSTYEPIRVSPANENGLGKSNKSVSKGLSQVYTKTDPFLCLFVNCRLAAVAGARFVR